MSESVEYRVMGPGVPPPGETYATEAEAVERAEQLTHNDPMLVPAAVVAHYESGERRSHMQVWPTLGQSYED